MSGKGRSYIMRLSAGEYKPSRFSQPDRSSPTASHNNSREHHTAAYWANIKAKNNKIRLEQAAALKIRNALVQKKKIENEARRITNAIKRQKEQNNRLSRAAAVNVKNAEKLNKIFKNNKTVLGKFKRLFGH